jgi:hypothetical protein
MTTGEGTAHVGATETTAAEAAAKVTAAAAKATAAAAMTAATAATTTTTRLRITHKQTTSDHRGSQNHHYSFQQHRTLHFFAAATPRVQIVSKPTSRGSLDWRLPKT